MAERYEKLKNIKDDQFRRLTGVKRQTFDRMVEILQEAFMRKMAFAGLKPKLSVADMLLLALEYLREYRTYFHIAKTYGVSESAAYRTSRPETEAIVDSGYQGLQKIHSKTRIPKKKSKKNPLTSSDKNSNQKIVRDRVFNENVIAMIKRFKIVGDRYRNRC